MGCLSVFDVSGIQQYLFKSSKLRENLGGSLLVTHSLKYWLIEAVKQVCGASAIDDWQAAAGFAMSPPSVNPPPAEILYVGGGNAMVAFADKQQAIETTQTFSRLLLENAPGLEIAVAHHPTDFKSYRKDRHELMNKTLFLNKQRRVRSRGLLGLAITRPCPQTGLPAVDNDGGTWLSAEAMAKRRAAGQDRFADLISDRAQYAFPLDIDKLGQIKGESHIAVICIDGNNMGKTLTALLQAQSDYTNAVATMRTFSKEVSLKYTQSLKEIVTMLEENTRQVSETYYTAQKLLLHTANGKALLPLRPLLMDGDDLVLVTDGRLGVSLAEHFLQCLGQKTLQVGSQNLVLSACAGVAIVTSHFPFYRACRLADELCASAKAKARALAGQAAGDMGSWLDFQVIFSGVTDSLSALRLRQYNVADRPHPEMLAAAGLQPYQRYNLCWRPWRADQAGGGSADDWDKLKAILRDLRDHWPRSWLKELRSAFIKDRSALNLLLSEAKSRGYVLSDFVAPSANVDRETGFDASNITPFFDALELSDFFLEIQQEVEQ